MTDRLKLFVAFAILFATDCLKDFSVLSCEIRGEEPVV